MVARRPRRSRRRGQSLVEYSLILALVAMVTFSLPGQIATRILSTLCSTTRTLGTISPDGSICSSSYVAVIKKDLPNGFYRMDDTSGTTAVDSSGQGRNATYTGGGVSFNQSGAIRGSSGLNSAVTLDGSSGYMTLPTAAFPSYPTNAQGSTTVYSASFECWFRTSSSGPILGDVGLGGGYVPALWVDTNGQLRYTMFYHGGASGPATVIQNVAPGTYWDNRWHDVVLTTSAGVDTLYADGMPVSQHATPLAQVPFDATSYIYLVGRASVAGWTLISNAFYSGSIDEVSVYSTALTPAQVAAHYQG